MLPSGESATPSAPKVHVHDGHAGRAVAVYGLAPDGRDEALCGADVGCSH